MRACQRIEAERPDFITGLQNTADRVLSGSPAQPAAVILVTGDRHEPTSHELTSPDAPAQLTRLLTNLPSDVHAVLATVAISRRACISCAWHAS